LIAAGIFKATIAYKLKLIFRRRFIVRVLFWIMVLIGLLLAEPLYNFLFSNNLTKTETLSLFDVIQITGIIIALYLINQAHLKTNALERRVHDLHQELSIRLSKDND
jgi:hypothetical protein